MVNTPLANLLALTQNANKIPQSNSFSKGKGPQLIQTGSGIINVPQQNESATKQDPNIPSSNESNLGALAVNAPSADPNLQNTALQASLPNTTENIDLSTDYAGTGLSQEDYDNYLNKTPVENAGFTDDEVGSKLGYEDHPYSLNGVELPSNSDLQKILKKDLTDPIMFNGANGKREADPVSQVLFKPYQVYKANSKFNELKDARDYLMSHSMTSDGRVFETDNSKMYKVTLPGPMRRTINRMKEAALLLGVPLMANGAEIPSNTPGSNPTSVNEQVVQTTPQTQQTITNTNNSSNNLTSQQTGSQSNLQAAGKTSTGAPNVTGSIFDGTQPEFDALAKMTSNILSRKSGATLDELNAFKKSINTILDSATNTFSVRAGAMGGLDNISYAFKNAGANSASVAAYVVKNNNLPANETISVKTMIDELQKKYNTLPASVIGTVLSQYLINESDEQYFRAETNRGNLSYIDSVEDTLKALSNPKAANSYASLKEDYIRFQNLFDEIENLDNKFGLAAQAVDKQTYLHNIYNGEPLSYYSKKSVNNANQKAYDYSADLVNSASEIFNKVYNMNKQ